MHRVTAALPLRLLALGAAACLRALNKLRLRLRCIAARHKALPAKGALPLLVGAAAAAATPATPAVKAVPPCRWHRLEHMSTCLMQT